ncbi:factor activating pos9, partial [Oleoguttula sp. CCFEE 5521]
RDQTPEMSNAHASQLSEAAISNRDSISEQNPLCGLCRSNNIWEHLTARHILTGKDWILGFIASPADVHEPERLACPFCTVVFRLLPSNAFAPEHVAQYHHKIKYCDIQPCAIRLGRKAVFTSYRVVYNYCEYVSHTASVYQAYRGQLALDSANRRRWKVEAVSAIQLGTKLDIKLARRWLKLCQNGHLLCDSVTNSDTASRFDIMLIDVAAGCLIDATTGHTYACLSYVWGQVPTLQTWSSNVKALRKPGSLFEKQNWRGLTRVVQDFIRMVEQLGGRFAWVDCLCIVQDDVASKEAQINAMDLIYSAAWLTIVQLSGKDANDGLAGAREGSRADCTLQIPGPGNRPTEDTRLVLTELPRWTQISRDESRHSSRGWTLQEELLSNRCLYLSDWGAWFQCQESRFSDRENGDMVMNVNDSDLVSIPSQLVNTRTTDAEQTDIEQILHWAVRAEWYSGRMLTYENDRTAAFQGILAHLGRIQSRYFLWGHPDDYMLPLSLLWVSVDTPRKSSEGILLPPSTPNGGVNVKYWDYVPESYTTLPSWSWARLRSKVSFQLVLMMHEAGVAGGLGPQCQITTRAAIDEEVERRRGIDQHLSPALFVRHCWRGTLDLTAPTIASHDLRWHSRGGPQMFDLDGCSGSMALASDLYEDAQAADKIRIGATIRNVPDAESKPCGLLYGEPFTGDNVEHFHYALLRTLNNQGVSREARYNFNRLAPGLWGDGEVVLSMVMYTDGDIAERMGLAFFTKAFWDSRDPSTQSWQLI